jgi:hypothetical protein
LLAIANPAKLWSMDILPWHLSAWPSMSSKCWSSAQWSMERCQRTSLSLQELVTILGPGDMMTLAKWLGTKSSLKCTHLHSLSLGLLRALTSLAMLEHPSPRLWTPSTTIEHCHKNNPIETYWRYMFYWTHNCYHSWSLISVTWLHELFFSTKSYA